MNKPKQDITDCKNKGARLWPETIEEACRAAPSHMARYYFARRFVEGKKVCDVASGAGYGSRFLAETAASVTAIDISQDAVSWAECHFSVDNVRYIAADATEDWPVEGGFDVVTSFETLEHLTSPAIFLKQVSKHLKADGMLVMSVPNGPRDQKRTDNPHHLHHFTDSELRNIVEDCFSGVEYFSQDYRKNYKHYGTKILRKIGVLKKQTYFLKNYFFAPGLRMDLKTWLLVAHK